MTVKPEKQIPGIGPVREQTLRRTKEKRIKCQTSNNVHLAYSEITLRCCSKNLETLSSSTCTAQSIPGETFRPLDTHEKRCGSGCPQVKPDILEHAYCQNDQGDAFVRNVLD
jgi:hypothetical protein